MMKTLICLYLIIQSSLCLSELPVKKIIFIGDSLTEGYQLAKENSYPSLIQKKLDSDGRGNYKVINGGVSGATTASGESRLKWFLKQKPEIVVLALGANDGLRGLKLANTQANLEKVITKAKLAGVKVILAGMHLPPNYGESYTKSFQEIYPRVAKKHQIPLIPFLLKGVAGNKELNLADGIHPNKKGYEIVAKTVYKFLKEFL